MTSPAADAERDALGGGDAASGLVRASDGVELHYLRWGSGRSPSWAVIIFLHGIASHGGWFAETAADLDTMGVAVYAPDRRGSGRSGGPRGHLNRYERALDDVDMVVRLVSAKHPGTPVFLAASSWAAKLGVVYAALRPAPLRLPLLLLQGEDDAMMDVAGTRRWFSGLGVEDKTYRAYPGAGHTLDFEPDRSRYLADMVGWLSARVPSGSSRSTGGGP